MIMSSHLVFFKRGVGFAKRVVAPNTS